MTNIKSLENAYSFVKYKWWTPSPQRVGGLETVLLMS